jgi:signal peptidase II
MQTTRGASLTDEKIDTGQSVGHRRVGILLTLAAVVLALDATSKALAVQQLADRPPLVLLDGVLTLRLVRNPGAAFGIATGLTAVFTLVAVGVILVILRLAPRLRSVSWAVALGLLLGGAAGNLVDRLLREPGPFRGHVVDWIELPHWPVFNLADSAIVCGGVLAVVLSARGIQLDGSRHRTT